MVFNKIRDNRFLQLCIYIWSWSKDTSHWVWAVIVNKDKHILSTWYNWFPRSIDDGVIYNGNRDYKLERIIHAEMNAILLSKTNICDTTLYTSYFPCANCAKHIIQCWIKAVVSYNYDFCKKRSLEWKFELSRRIFQEWWVRLVFYSKEWDLVTDFDWNL